MMIPDIREALDPAWETLARKRGELVWECHYSEQYQRHQIGASYLALNRWEKAHAEEWNRLKPWYERRLPSWIEGHGERMMERFSEKQKP